METTFQRKKKKEKLQSKSHLNLPYYTNKQQEFKGKHSSEQWVAFRGHAVAFPLTSPCKKTESCFPNLQAKCRGLLEDWSAARREADPNPHWMPDKLQKHLSTHCYSRGGSVKALGWAKHPSPGIWSIQSLKFKNLPLSLLGILQAKPG